MVQKQEAPKGAGKKLVLIFVTLFIVFQFFQVDKTNPPYNKQDEIKAPKKVLSILKKSCYDCHSNETKWPWYSLVAPISWEVSRHVKYGRAYLNFSIWETYTQEEKDKKLEEIYRTIYAAMPPQNYLTFHKEAHLSKDERDFLRTWTGKAPY